MEKQKEITIRWDEQDMEFTIKRMNLKERNEVRRQAMKVRQVHNSQPIVDMDLHVLQEVALLKCLIKAPFDINMKNIQELDFELADKIYAEIESINSLSQEKKNN